MSFKRYLLLSIATGRLPQELLIECGVLLLIPFAFLAAVIALFKAFSSVYLEKEPAL